MIEEEDQIYKFTTQFRVYSYYEGIKSFTLEILLPMRFIKILFQIPQISMVFSTNGFSLKNKFMK